MELLKIICTQGRHRRRSICLVFSGLFLLVSTIQIWNSVSLNNSRGQITDNCSDDGGKLLCTFGRAWDNFGKNTDSTEEMKHIAFLKVHKAASSTVMNILMRFGYARNLSFILPKNSLNIISQTEHLQQKNIHEPLVNKTKFDILCHHVIYKKSALQRYLHNDAFYVSILRDPFDQFVSSFNYFRKVWGTPYLHNISGEFPMSELLRHPNRYEPKIISDSFTNNRMSFDLGFPLSVFDSPSPGRISRYISHLDSSFHFVMIKEYFDESVVLLKHFLNWTMKDILYVRQNTLRHYRIDLDVQPGDRELHRQRARLDYALYDHFLFRFWEHVQQQGPEFHREVMYFKHLRQSVETFCRHVFSKDIGIFQASDNKWHKSFQITKQDCYLIMMTENDFSLLLKHTQYPYLRPTRQTPKRHRKRKVLPPVRPNIYKGPI